MIAERTGKEAKTHKGAHIQFARLTKDEPRIDLELRRFLPQSYDMKAIADYETGPGAVIPQEQAATAICDRRPLRRVHSASIDLAYTSNDSQCAAPTARSSFVRSVRSSSRTVWRRWLRRGRTARRASAPASSATPIWRLGTPVERVLEAMIAAGGGRVCAIRFITASHPDQAGWGSPIIRPAGLLVDQRVREGFARLAPRGLSFDAWMYHTQLGDLVDLAGAFRRNWPRPGDPISRVASPPSAPRAMFESNFPVDKGSCSFAAL